MRGALRLAVCVLAPLLIAACGDGSEDRGIDQYCDRRATVEQAMAADRDSSTTDGQVPDVATDVAILKAHIGELRELAQLAPAEIADDWATSVAQWERVVAGSQAGPNDEGLAAEARIAAFDREHCR